ncbi:MAG: hypothetical protein LBE76_02285 [Nitrososphaerota archaeon]|nr:hypothetical protein [Nitrososphaerota archaeon]
MHTSVNIKTGSPGNKRRNLILVSLLIVVLASSLCVYMFMLNNDDGVVCVTSESELRNAVDNAPYAEMFVITFDNDITLTGGLSIPTGKDIILSSKNQKEYFKLINANNGIDSVLYVWGTLRINGIIITHAEGTTGRGVEIGSSGTFHLYSGKISGNNIWGINGGGGVLNQGTFEMYGGTISGNSAANGGGVDNSGVFTMYGGTISGNVARYPHDTHGVNSGGGVCTSGTFVMYDGTISDNTARVGGGVYRSWGSFDWRGGKIYGNTADTDENVYEYQ